jgi:hypothetical protein
LKRVLASVVGRTPGDVPIIDISLRHAVGSADPKQELRFFEESQIAAQRQAPRSLGQHPRSIEDASAPALI